VLTGRFYEDAGEDFWVWKTKWNIPAIGVKAVSQYVKAYAATPTVTSSERIST
jgi:hypothetical protein